MNYLKTKTILAFEIFITLFLIFLPVASFSLESLTSAEMGDLTGQGRVDVEMDKVDVKLKIENANFENIKATGVNLDLKLGYETKATAILNTDSNKIKFEVSGTDAIRSDLIKIDNINVGNSSMGGCEIKNLRVHYLYIEIPK